MSTGAIVVVGLVVVAGAGGAIWYVSQKKRSAPIAVAPVAAASKSKGGLSTAGVISTVGSAVALSGSIASLLGY